jgi:hypothetical protein
VVPCNTIAVGAIAPNIDVSIVIGEKVMMAPGAAKSCPAADGTA